MVELMKQGQYQPLTTEKQILALYAGTAGYLDSIPVKEVRRFEMDLYEFVDMYHKDSFTSMREKGKKKEQYDSLVSEMRAILDEFTPRFQETIKGA